VAELPLTKTKTARLYPFTKMFLDHVHQVGMKRRKSIEDRYPRDSIFKIGKRRARDIIYNFHEDFFPHYLRACALSNYISIIKDPVAVARMFGLKKLETLMKYYGKTWEAYKEELSR
jgi:hypothetical protein